MKVLKTRYGKNSTYLLSYANTHRGNNNKSYSDAGVQTYLTNSARARHSALLGLGTRLQLGGARLGFGSVGDWSGPSRNRIGRPAEREFSVDTGTSYQLTRLFPAK